MFCMYVVNVYLVYCRITGISIDEYESVSKGQVRISKVRWR